MIRVLVLVAATGLACAQMQLTGLTSGYVLDEHKQVLRPVVGIPGSAYLGSAVALPFPVKQAAIRQSGAVAVVISAEPKPRAWLIRGMGAPSELGPADEAYLDDKGTLAVLSLARRSIQLVTLKEEAMIGPAIEAAPQAVAFDDETGCAVLANRAEAGLRLDSLCPERAGETRPLRFLVGAEPAAMVYSRRLHALLLADRRAGHVLLIRAPIESGEVEVLGEGGTVDPMGIEAISDREVLVVQGQPAGAVVIDVRSRRVTGVIEMPATAERLEYLVRNRILACSRVNRSPLLVIDLDQERSAFLIPPAGEE